MNLHYSVPQQKNKDIDWLKVAAFVTLAITLILVLAMALGSRDIPVHHLENDVITQSHGSQLLPRAVPVPTPPAAHIHPSLTPLLTATPLPTVAQPSTQPVQTPSASR